MSKNEPSGLSLLDIGPLYEDVPYGKRKVRVYGVSAAGILSVFQRFAEIGQWFRGSSNGAKVDVKKLMAEAPAAIGAIIAAGCGSPGDAKAEKIAGLIPADTQLDILEAIGRLTFKNGFGPFVKRIVALSDAAKSVNYGRGQDTASPQTSKPSPPPATPTPPSGP